MKKKLEISFERNEKTFCNLVLHHAWRNKQTTWKCIVFLSLSNKKYACNQLSYVVVV